MTSTAGQLGTSIGTAVLNPIAGSATASYLAAHPASAHAEATLAGYSVAALAGVATLLGATVFVVVLINSRPVARRAAAPGS